MPRSPSPTSTTSRGLYVSSPPSARTRVSVRRPILVVAISPPVVVRHDRRFLCRVPHGLCRDIIQVPASPSGYQRTKANKMPELVNRLVSIQEAREQYLGGLGRTTVYELIKRGELVQVHVGRRSFITAKSLEAYVNRLSEAASV